MSKINALEREFEKITGIVFSEFYKTQKPKLTRHLTFHWTRDPELAEDFAEDAIIQALQKIKTFNSDKSQVHTWLYTIAENMVKKAHKDKEKLPSVSLDKNIDNSTTLASFIPYQDSNSKIRDFIELCYKCQIVIDAIESLDDKYRNVMRMREIENHSYKNISDSLGINLSTIKSQILKGRELVRKKVLKKFSYIDEHGLTYSQTRKMLELLKNQKSVNQFAYLMENGAKI